MFFWKKEKQIEQAVEDYLRETEQCVASFAEAMEIFFREALSSDFEALVEKTHVHEHASDERRREIEASMYDKALIPESRGDILLMLEALDLVPNKCESVLYQIWTQNMAIPEAYMDAFKQLVQVNVESHALLCRSMRNLFLQASAVRKDAVDITTKESYSDRIERRLIKDIFNSDMEKADKILLKELVLEMGAISDRAENAADSLRIVAVKRRS